MMNEFDALLEELYPSSPAMELDILAGGDPELPKNERAAPIGTQDNQPITNDQGSQMATSPEDPAGDPTEENPNMDDGMDGMGDSGLGGDLSGMGNGEIPSGETSTTPKQDPNDLQRKINLRKEIKALYDQVCANIDSMNRCEPPSTPAESKLFFEAEKKLDDIKNLLFSMATRDIYNNEYVDTIRRFTAVDKAYALCIDILNRLIPKDSKKDN